MQRIPEPDLMNEARQALAYAEADFSEPHDAFVAEFRARFPDFDGGPVLDLGCGPADISCRFANAYPQSIVVGVDGAPEMLKLGRQRITQQQLTQRVQLHQVYLPQDAMPNTTAFTAIICNSLLHHLKDPMALWQTLQQQARPGQCIFIMDLLRPASREQTSALVDLYASEEPEILQRDFFHSLCAAYRPAEIRYQLQQAGLDLTIETISDRHLIVFGQL